MKGFIMTGLCCLVLFPSWGQKQIERTLAWTNGRPITLALQFGNRIRIRSWDRQEMKVEISVDINHNSLNEALKIGFSEGKEGLTVSSDLDKAMLDKADCRECQDSTGCSIFNNKKTCMTITYEIYVPSGAPVNVQTINANLEIYDTRGPLQAKTISGFIDMTASSRFSANILMNTITGDCFSDFIINDGEVSTKNSAGGVGVRIKGTINGGGVPIDLSSISNNIYLRKNKGSASGARPHPIITWTPAALIRGYAIASAVLHRADPGFAR